MAEETAPHPEALPFSNPVVPYHINQPDETAAMLPMHCPCRPGEL